MGETERRAKQPEKLSLRGSSHQVSFQYRLKFDRVYDLYATLGSDYEPHLACR